jgi:predicted ArsR family transcriptional regulator
MDPTDVEQQITGLIGLTEPVRRALYRYVSAQETPVGRDEAASAIGISRALAAYHLDRLVDDGLLQASFERRSGRRGPGAGRPTKLYSRSSRRIELSLPPRDYATVAELLARAVEADPTDAAALALDDAARALGAELGDEAAGELSAKGHRQPALGAVREVLAKRGYEPYEDDDGSVVLRNCPFDRIAERHPQLVCRANLALVEGLVDRLGGQREIRPVLDPKPGRCCVALCDRSAQDDTPSGYRAN